MKEWIKNIISFFKKEPQRKLKPPSEWTPRDVTPINYLD